MRSRIRHALLLLRAVSLWFHDSTMVSISSTSCRAPAAVVNGENLRRFLSLTVAPNVHVANEDGVWAIFMPGQPFAAESTDLAEGLEDFVDALRDYAEAWTEDLHDAPNHQENWALVQLVELSTDEQLTAWLTGSAERAPSARRPQ